MLKKIIVPVAIVAALSVGGAVVASSAPAPKATGGGQTEVGDRGAGDTIAFTAQNTGSDSAAKGQVQYVDRTGGTGQGQVVLHGVVSCLRVTGTSARLGGFWSDGGDFEVFVQDNGEPNQGNDMIAIYEASGDPNCVDDNQEEDDPSALGRGNAQVHGS